MDVHLHTKIDDVVEAFRVALHQQAEYWSTIRTPSALFDFEQGLQAVLNRLQTGIVGAVLEAIHRDRDFVTACQHQVPTSAWSIQRWMAAMYGCARWVGQRAPQDPVCKTPKEWQAGR